MDPNIFSIIVTYNHTISEFSNNLNSHLKTSVTGLIIIDNNSDNKNDIQRIIESKSSSKNVILKLLDDNYGIGYAQNVGIKIAKENKGSYVILFDQDSIPPQRIADILISEEQILLAKGLKVGAIGPVHIDSRTGKEYPLARIKGITLQKVWPSKVNSHTMELSFIIASGTLIKMENLAKIGQLNEALFIDLVDIEWCFRATNFGFKIYATKLVSLLHSIGDERIYSFNKEISFHSEQRRYYMIRNQLLLIRKPYVPIGFKIRLLASIPLGLLRFLIAVKFKRSYLRLITLGFVHGLLNIGGKINE
jgi:rhamnosyltransferase